jgi:hypothetical protein
VEAAGRQRLETRWDCLFGLTSHFFMDELEDRNGHEVADGKPEYK